MMKTADDEGTSVSDEDWAEIASAVKRSGTSFYTAMRILPKYKRNAMYAIYAFCRAVDDIADEPGEEAAKLRRLSQWRDEIRLLARGSSGSPLARALEHSRRLFDLQESDFIAVIEGMETDAASSLRIGDMDELMIYCDRVACAVGRLSNRVFGLDSGPGGRLAGALGRALQLTNILRDIAEDAAQDRVYVPADLLARHGIEAGDAAATISHPGFAPACETLAEIADRNFAEAEAELAACGRRQMRPAILMMAAYRRIFVRLRRRGWRNLDHAVGLSRADKIWIFLRHGLV